jgi:hypothetical protein
MLGIGLDIRKDHGSGLSGSGSDSIPDLIFSESGSGVILVNHDEDIASLVKTGDQYTIGKLVGTGSGAMNDQVEGTFSVTLQRCSEADDGTITVIATSGPATLYGYIDLYNNPSGTEFDFMHVALIPADGYTPSFLGAYYDVIIGNTPGIDATSFGGQDITTNVQAEYRIKWTYTVGGQTSAEFTSGLFPIAALTA